MRKKYGQTFLTKRRFQTMDYHKAKDSFFIWGEDLQGNGVYYLTLLGIVNGILGHFGYVAVVDVEDGFIVSKLKIVKQWW